MATVTRFKMRREDQKRIQCPECKSTIRQGQVAVTIDSQTYHEDCAGMAGKLQACTECFMTPCEC